MTHYVIADFHIVTAVKEGNQFIITIMKKFGIRIRAIEFYSETGIILFNNLLSKFNKKIIPTYDLQINNYSKAVLLSFHCLAGFRFVFLLSYFSFLIFYRLWYSAISYLFLQG